MRSEGDADQTLRRHGPGETVLGFAGAGAGRREWASRQAAAGQPVDLDRLRCARKGRVTLPKKPVQTFKPASLHGARPPPERSQPLRHTRGARRAYRAAGGTEGSPAKGQR